MARAHGDQHPVDARIAAMLIIDIDRGKNVEKPAMCLFIHAAVWRFIFEGVNSRREETRPALFAIGEKLS